MSARILLPLTSATQKRPQSGLWMAIAPFGMGRSGVSNHKPCGRPINFPMLDLTGIDLPIDLPMDDPHMDCFEVDGNTIRIGLVSGFVQHESGRFRDT